MLMQVSGTRIWPFIYTGPGNASDQRLTEARLRRAPHSRADSATQIQRRSLFHAKMSHRTPTLVISNTTPEDDHIRGWSENRHSHSLVALTESSNDNMPCVQAQIPFATRLDMRTPCFATWTVSVVGSSLASHYAALVP
jgi:hypothetical protein